MSRRVDERGLQQACEGFRAVTGQHVDEHLREAVHDAISVYLAALPSPVGVRVKELAQADFDALYVAAKVVARYRGEIAQVEARLNARQDYRFYMDPKDAALDEALQKCEDARIRSSLSLEEGEKP